MARFDPPQWPATMSLSGAEAGYRPGSDTQENLATIEKTGERDGEYDAKRSRGETSGARHHRAIEQGRKVASDETLRERLEAQHIVDKVKRDGVGAEPDKGRRPAPEPPDIDDLM